MKCFGHSRKSKKQSKIKMICNHCGREFYFRGLANQEVAPGVEKFYFVCPYCGEQYRAFYETATTKRIKMLLRDEKLAPDRRLHYVSMLRKTEEGFEARFESGQKN